MNQNRNQRTGALNPAQRNTVRVALATGATIATLIGAQTLALLEQPTVAVAERVNAPITITLMPDSSTLDQQSQTDVQSNADNFNDDTSGVSQQSDNSTVIQQNSIQYAQRQPNPVSHSSR
ncbi:MAG: hypothetical protein ABI947_01495 [Chloroflexota bacterium]